MDKNVAEAKLLKIELEHLIARIEDWMSEFELEQLEKELGIEPDSLDGEQIKCCTKPGPGKTESHQRA